MRWNRIRLFFSYQKKATADYVPTINARAPPASELTTEYKMLIACHDGYPEIVKSLLDAIHLACSKGGKEIVEVLVHHHSCDVLEGGS